MFQKFDCVYFVLLFIFFSNVQGQRSKNTLNAPSTASRKQFSQLSSNNLEDLGAIDPRCPDRNGRYPIPSQCDAYLECNNGIAEDKLCPDGLLFNPAAGIFSYPCSYPIDVDCTGRSSLQQAQSTEECPRQYGYYKFGDEKNCGQFKNCVDGRGFIFDCPEGLAFNSAIYKCDWPDQVEDCDAEAFLGFSCPNLKDFNLGDQEYVKYADPNNCQSYFLCLNGRPRKLSCGENKAFNVQINACDDVENVPNCNVGIYSRDSFPSPSNAPPLAVTKRQNVGRRNKNRN